MTTGRKRMYDWILRTFVDGWEGTADEWWAQHPDVKTINSIAPCFTYMKQKGLIEPAGVRRPTRNGGEATPYRFCGQSVTF
jgi:hypothetical protein